MPSAEKVTKLETKLEVIQSLDQKASENVQKEGDQNNGEKNNFSPLPPIQQGLQVIQNKIRNLEKRKNKLDGYVKEEEAGRELSSEQAKAVSKYDEVVNQLGISKEFFKQIQVIATVASKEAKRDARKAGFLRQMQETAKVREVVIIQDILKQLKNELIRNDFLQGSNGACLVEVMEMNVLEQFSKHTIPVHPSFSNEPSFLNSAKSAADHLSFLVDGRNRQFLETGFSYEKIKELFTRIQACGYWEKDIKIVEASTSSPSITQERPAESETPQSSDDLESKEDKVEMAEMTAPLPTQVPNPTQLFNGGNVNPMMTHHHAVPMQQIAMKPATVTAVENAFFNQMKYSQGQGPPAAAMGLANPPNRYIEDFSSSSISFLQDSLVEQQQQQHQAPISQAQPKIPTNFVSQPKHSPVQQQQGNAVQQQPMNSFHHHQQPQTHHYPPGLKLQNNANNIPVNFSQQPSQTQQQHSNVPPHLIQQQPAYPQPASVSQPQQQFPQKMPTNIQNLQDIEQKTTALAHVQPAREDRSSHDLSENRTTPSTNAQTQQPFPQDKDKSRNNEWNSGNNQQQPPPIDTWTPETTTTGNQGGNFSRFNRGNNRSGGTGGSKFNNYRGSQQSRNNNGENGGGDPAGGSSNTFFRNNERYTGGNRFNNNERGGTFNRQREGNYRAGSGRIAPGSGSSVPMSSSGARK